MDQQGEEDDDQVTNDVRKVMTGAHYADHRSQMTTVANRAWPSAVGKGGQRLPRRATRGAGPISSRMNY